MTEISKKAQIETLEKIIRDLKDLKARSQLHIYEIDAKIIQYGNLYKTVSGRDYQC